MKHINTFLRKPATLLALILFLGAAMPANAQTLTPIVPFTQRTAAGTPNTKVYNIKGDFQMIGNKNLTADTYSATGSNDVDMVYVDIDGDAATLNSSSAELVYSTENGAIPECTNIIYAGLYWLGRAHNANSGLNPNSPNTWTETNNRNNNSSFNGYTLTISSTGNNPQTATYIFTPATGNPVIFKLTTNDNEQITGLTVQTGINGTPANLTSTRTDYNSEWWNENYVQATLNTPYTVNTGTTSILVNNLRASTSNNTIDGTFFANVTIPAKTLDKSVVKLKYGTGAYTTVSAQDDAFTKNIYYPTAADGYMYSAYAEVTDFVKGKGQGVYTVADIALNEGTGDGTGLFGGWALVVVYENPKMTLRDVTIFDGHAHINDLYVEGTGAERMTYGTLPVSGFNTVQEGDVNMKIGIVAGEGDIGVGGGTLNANGTTSGNVDNFSILDANTTTETYRPLSTATNPVTNFFTSGIQTTGTRNPSDTNNYGIDIVNVIVPPEYLKNEQTSTTFRYGTNQDTYIIPVIAMAVDAYIPDLRPFISGSVGDEPIGGTTPIKVDPGADIVYKLEISNPPTSGNEAINNLVISIDVPYTTSFVSATAVINGAASPGTVSHTDNLITWNVGNIPLQAAGAPPYATLTYILKVTEDPTILCNPNCTPKVILVGSASGTGAESGSDFSNLRFIQGYDTSGQCENAPITTPLTIDINTDNLPEDYCNAAGGGNISFTYCDLSTTAGNPINFPALQARFPAGVRFWSAYETEAGTNFVKPTEGATEYIGADIDVPSGQTEVMMTYYAIPPGTTTCYWIVTIKVEKCNFWMGTNSNVWDLGTNWTQGIPGSGTIKNDVTFATVSNYGIAAVNDLIVDDAVTGMKTINNLTNNSDKALIIPVEKTLVIKEKATTSGPDRLIIKSEKEKANGALIFEKPNQNEGVQATVEFASKSKPASGTWPRAWQYFGTPVTGKKLNELFPTNIQGSIYGGNPAANTIVRRYDESLNLLSSYQEKWADMDPAETVLAYRGYEITQPQSAFDNATAPYRFRGPLVTANSNVSLPISPDGIYARGSFILANPYAAPIFYDNIVDGDFENLQKVFYIFNTGSRQDWLDQNGETELGELPGTYTSIPVYSGQTMGKTQIPSMQGFLVAANDLTGSTPVFKFRYATVYRPTGNTTPNEPMLVQRAGGSSNAKGKPMRETWPLITMDVIGQNSSDRLYLITADEASKGYDDGWDGYKFIAPDLAQLYAFDSDGNRLQVNSDNNLNGTYIGFTSGGETSYKLRFTFSKVEEAYSDVFLEDLATGVTHTLKDGLTLTFTPSSGTAEKRFKLTAKPGKKKPGDTNSKFLKIHTANNLITLDNSTEENGLLKVYDLVGSNVFESVFIPGANDFTLSLNKGSYIIEAKTASERSVVKSILK